MANEIPHEVLLPLAYDMYKKIPSPLQVKVCTEEEWPGMIEKAANSFADFYNRLYNNLANHDKK